MVSAPEALHQKVSPSAAVVAGVSGTVPVSMVCVCVGVSDEEAGRRKSESDPSIVALFFFQ